MNQLNHWEIELLRPVTLTEFNTYTSIYILQRQQMQPIISDILRKQVTFLRILLRFPEPN